ncbi:lipopolysaccharide assembly protein LapA domain-containing protein [Vagococcus sp.]|uniref:lipopolysaccharide assembly protein LapA domain-containing protein n=1 Tax=Vagococcus sp. TaxID=1933889 RepID=UPI003F9E7081
MKKTGQFYSILVLALVVVIFSVVNSQNIEVNFIFKKVEMPLVIVIIISLLIGVMISSLVFGMGRLSSKKEIKTLRNELNEMKKTHREVKEVVPLEDMMEEDETTEEEKEEPMSRRTYHQE